VPFPTSLSNQILPPCFFTITVWAKAKPCPVPLPTSLVVKNGSKILPRTFSGMPAPVSLICTSTQSPSEFVVIVIVHLPPEPFFITSPMACAALISKLRITWLNSPAKQGTGGSLSAKQV
jgi:hypothetical protein